VLGVRRRELGVTRRAIRWNDRRIAVRLMAVGARDVRMNADRGVRALRLCVTRNASRRGLRRERVTREAIVFRMRRAEHVRVSALGFVTRRARRNARIFETDFFVIVTSLARDVVIVDVNAVSHARTKLAPLRWDELWWNAVAAMHDVNDERDDRRCDDRRGERGTHDFRSPRHGPLA
jgi:hypothetical protein